MVNAYLDYYGVALPSSEHKARAFHLYKMAKECCRFEVHHIVLADPTLENLAGKQVSFYLPNQFQDLLYWVCGYEYTGSLAKRKRALALYAEELRLASFEESR